MVAKFIAALIIDQLDAWLPAIDRTNWMITNSVGKSKLFSVVLDELREIFLNISTIFSDYKRKVQLLIGNLDPSYRLVNDPTSLLCRK
jgi:hypothetical protein